MLGDKSALVRPEKELKAFAKVDLAPGETAVYFLGVRPIKMTVNGETKSRFSQSETSDIGEARRTATQIKDLFLRSIKF